MKKNKPEKSAIPISLSAKKSTSLKHQMLFTPYKIQWKNVQPAANAQLSSRTFFNTMKNDLCNLKNDVQKMIRKQPKNQLNEKASVLQETERYRNVKNMHVLAQSSNNIFQSDAQINEDQNSINKKVQEEKEGRVLIQKRQHIQQLLKQNKLQKNLICQLKKQNNQLYEEMQQKIKSIQKQYKHSQQLLQRKQLQILKMKENISVLEKDLNEIKDKNERYKSLHSSMQLSIENEKNSKCLQFEELKNNNQQIKLHNIFLQQKIQSLSQKMLLVTQKFKQREGYIKQLEAKLQAHKIAKRNNQILQEQEKFKAQQNFDTLMREKQNQLKIKFQIQMKNSHRQFLQQIQQIEMKMKDAVNQLELQNQQLAQKIAQLQLNQSNKNVNICQCHLEIESRKSTNKQMIDFSLLGVQYENKINKLYEQNYSLKNKIIKLESQIQKYQFHKKSLLDQLRIYEQLEQEQKQKFSLNEFQRIVQQNHRLQRQKQSIIEDSEMKVIKLQNQIQHYKRKSEQRENNVISSTGVNFNKILKEQLQQNQRLKDKAKQLNHELHQLQHKYVQKQQKYDTISQQLAFQKAKSNLLKNTIKLDEEQGNKNQRNIQITSGKLKADLDNLQKKYEMMNSMIEEKNRIIKGKDQFIQKVLISKINKKQQQQQIEFLIKEVKKLSF